MYKALIVLLLLFNSGLLYAKSGCEAASRFSNYATNIAVSTSAAKPRPGQQVTLTAQLTTSGAFAVSCQNPDGVKQIGGTISLYADGTNIGNMQISQYNTQPIYYTSYVDYVCEDEGLPPPNCTFRYYANNITNFSVNYVVPKGVNPHTITATFSGDNYFSQGSNSQALKIIPTTGITPIINYLLEN